MVHPLWVLVYVFLFRLGPHRGASGKHRGRLETVETNSVRACPQRTQTAPFFLIEQFTAHDSVRPFENGLRSLGSSATRPWGYSAFQYTLPDLTPETNRCASRFATTASALRASAAPVVRAGAAQMRRKRCFPHWCASGHADGVATQGSTQSGYVPKRTRSFGGVRRLYCIVGRSGVLSGGLSHRLGSRPARAV